MRNVIFLLAGLPLFGQDSLTLQSKSIAAQEQAVAQRMRASLDLQVASVRKQARLPAQSATAFLVASLEDTKADAPVAPDLNCDPLPPMRVGKLVEDASRRSGVSAGLLNAVMREESAFRPCAVSGKGARGLMQLMPAAMEDFGVTDAFDPEQNVSAGAALLKQLIERYGGDLNRVLGAYNAGPARVDAAGGVPPFPETRRYVDRILGNIDPGSGSTGLLR
jgi:soluble lytic murein transglycosylase-like protein